MKNNAKGLTPMYIVLVPIVLVVVLLNSGFLQRLFPAAEVRGSTYQVNQYNYYYFTAYNALLEADYETEDFDPSQEADEQTRADGSTWFDWFCAQADQRIAEVAYYNDLAANAGYIFTEADMAPMNARLAEMQTEAAVNSLAMKDYYVAYYGTGMTESAFLTELQRDYQADAYRAHLISSGAPADVELDAWLSEHPTEDYDTANLQLIVLSAVPDRFSGEIGAQQLTDLSAKLDQLVDRYEADPASFEALAAAYSSRSDVTENSGSLTDQRKEDLPATVSAWCFSAQPGDVFHTVDPESGEGYLAVLNGWGGSAARLEASAALRSAHVDETAQAALADYTVEHNSLGMKFAGK